MKKFWASLVVVLLIVSTLQVLAKGNGRYAVGKKKTVAGKSQKKTLALDPEFCMTVPGTPNLVVCASGKAGDKQVTREDLYGLKKAALTVHKKFNSAKKTKNVFKYSTSSGSAGGCSSEDPSCPSYCSAHPDDYMYCGGTPPSSCVYPDWDEGQCGGSYCSLYGSSDYTNCPSEYCSANPEDYMYCGGTLPSSCVYPDWDEGQCGGSYCSLYGSSDYSNCPSEYCLAHPDDYMYCGG